MKVKRCLFILTIFYLVFLLLDTPYVDSSMVNHTTNNYISLNMAEQYILDQLAIGNVADLAKRFGNDRADRIIRPWFIRALLAGQISGIRCPENIVIINSAIITKALNLSFIDSSYTIKLSNCRFNEKVIINNSHFHNVISFEGSSFYDDVYCESVKADKSIFLTNCIFYKSATLHSSFIGGYLNADETQFTKKGGIVNFSNLKISHDFSLRKTVFLFGYQITFEVHKYQYWEFQTPASAPGIVRRR